MEKKKIKIYSTSTCPNCAMLKDFLKEHRIEYEEVDVARDRAALLEMREMTGQLGVPVVVINGTIIVGFDKEALVKELAL